MATKTLGYIGPRFIKCVEGCLKSQVQKKQERMVLLVAVGIIGLSVATTLYFSDFLLSKFGADGDGGYRNVTFTDALVKCQKKTRETYDGELSNITFDDHSSRFDQSANQYKIFFKADMIEHDDDSDGGFYINCFVSARTGRIGDFEGMEQKANRAEPLRRNDGGLFGWPIKK